MFVLWILLAVGLLLLVRGLTSRSSVGGQDDNPENALEILERRYAKGVLSEEQLELLQGPGESTQPLEPQGAPSVTVVACPGWRITGTR